MTPSFPSAGRETRRDSDLEGGEPRTVPSGEGFQLTPCGEALVRNEWRFRVGQGGTSVGQCWGAVQIVPGIGRGSSSSLWLSASVQLVSTLLVARERTARKEPPRALDSNETILYFFFSQVRVENRVNHWALVSAEKCIE